MEEFNLFFFYSIDMPGLIRLVFPVLGVERERVVEVASPREEHDIRQIRKRMATLLDIYRGSAELEGLAGFMFVYHAVTDGVAERMLEGESYFNSPEDLERLDARFAEMYFRPVREYLGDNRAVRPWKTYFNYCFSGDSRASVEMLLGINAHINADLVHALHIQEYGDREDFRKINRILENQLSPSMHYLLKRHDIAGLAGTLDKRLAHREFRKLVVKWRENAWRNYRCIQGSSFSKHRDRLYSQTEEVAEKIVKLEENFNYLNLYSTLKKANQLEVDITE